MTRHPAPPPTHRTLDARLAFHATHRPEYPALVCGGVEVTYGRLYAESARGALALAASGLTKGSRVGYLGKESVRFYELLYACAAAGAVLVPVNWRLAPTEVEYILRDSRAELLFVEEEFLPTAHKIRPDLPDLRHLVLLDGTDESARTLKDWKDTGRGAAAPAPATTDDAVAQMYTSGTTGLPKGVVLAHRSFFAVRGLLDDAGLDWIDFRPDDVSLIGISGSHIGGLWYATQGFNAGVTNVALRSFGGREVLHLIRESGVTTAFLVPAMLLMLLSEPDAAEADFATLRKVVYGGSPISESLLQQCISVMRCDLAQIYGLTETGNTAVCLPPADHVPGSPRLRAAGRAYPGIELRIVAPDGRALPPGEVGEVCIKTPARMLEYWRLTDATAATLRDGWLHTGDAGYLDADGYLFIQDRIKEMIVRAGENIFPAEVENALCAHPAVLDAAVIGVPDDRWGEAVHAFLALRPGAFAAPYEIRTFLRGRLADFKVPTRYTVVDSVPRNPSGKILRRTLREQFWADRDRAVN
ncbi:long-chain-fatty-acid--CoA ligase [Streptomyces catenulae]|uniref:Long-chain-fatty-acid--CoA ligase n=1 Tax=Streptomyces catenulae TaxID=66875 RepID=A0ABV2Z692_9ACTN|nr:long-chain-fatty-acid--CoA ligase [Streptomyces catenulae]